MQKVIGLVHTRFAPSGGVENYINKLAPSLLERNWQMHYFMGRVRQPVPAGMIVYKISEIRGTSIGLVFPGGDTSALAHAIERVLADPEFRDRIAAGGKRTVRERFSLERMADDIERLYENVLNR